MTDKDKELERHTDRHTDRDRKLATDDAADLQQDGGLLIIRRYHTKEIIGHVELSQLRTGG